ncbi:MAG: M20 family metallopeptidase [Caldilinea sp.]|nr:M20 family metallopeptidase [Caldilinea sp.]MDW8441226.1 M20 family metallopeptidase [Caldilineaceae bacterium]
MLSVAERQALACVDDEELIRRVQELTRIPSVWKPESGQGEEAAARWVEARCREIGLETHFEFVQPGRPNVIAFHRMADGPTLMFEGHTDVVTEGDPAAWSAPPFSAVIRGGRIYGRGANDMKAGLVAALTAIKAIVQSGVRLKGTLLLAALCDEEGDMIGVKHFVERGWADQVSAAIICEPEENRLCVTQKGVMWIHVILHGVMAHGAMPLTGINSAYPLAKFLSLLHSLEQRVIAEHGVDPFLGKASITPTIVMSPARGHGEAQKNVMPGASEAVLDIRLIPGQDPNALAREIETLLQSIVAGETGLRYEFRVLEVRHPTFTDPDHPVVAALASAYTDLTGQPPVYGGVPGSTDGTILNARKGIPIVTCGPGDVHIPHHIDEWVDIEEIKTAARLYVLAAMRYLGLA